MRWRDLYRLAVCRPGATAALSDYADRAVIGSGDAALLRTAVMYLNTAANLDLSIAANLTATYTLCRALDAHAVPLPDGAEAQIGELRQFF